MRQSLVRHRTIRIPLTCRSPPGGRARRRPGERRGLEHLSPLWGLRDTSGPCRAEQYPLGLPLPGPGPVPSGGLTTNSRRTGAELVVIGGWVEVGHRTCLRRLRACRTCQRSLFWDVPVAEDHVRPVRHLFLVPSKTQNGVPAKILSCCNILSKVLPFFRFRCPAVYHCGRIAVYPSAHIEMALAIFEGVAEQPSSPNRDSKALFALVVAVQQDGFQRNPEFDELLVYRWRALRSSSSGDGQVQPARLTQ